jgi:hypothetical protein
MLKSQIMALANSIFGRSGGMVPNPDEIADVIRKMR